MISHLLIEIAKVIVGALLGNKGKETAVPPNRFDVEPTLRGLRVKQEAGLLTGGKGVLYPWECVGPTQESIDKPCWHVYNEDGSVVEVDGQPVQLVLADEKLGRTSKRAQRRRLERLWMQGDLDISDNYQSALAKRTSIKSVLIFLGVVALFIAAFLRLWVFPKATITRHNQLTMTGIFLPGVFMFIGIPLLWFLRGRRSRGLLNVAQATFSSEGIAARLRDGGETWCEWEKLVDLYDGFDKIMMEFSDGTVLYFSQEPRTVAVCEIATRRYKEKLADRNDARVRRGLRRALVYAVAGLGFVAMIVLARLVGGSALRAIANGPCMLLGAPIVGIPVVIVICMIEKAVRQHKRRRQREEAKRAQPLVR
jgi:hypothetical protein